MRRELTIGETTATRLDVYLAEACGVSRSEVQRWFKAGAVQVNGESARARTAPEPGAPVVIDMVEETRAPLDIPQPPIVYQDDDLLVIDKPAGLTVHGGNGRIDETTVVDFARQHTNDPDAERPGIVHRLDRDTSGLLVLAKTAAAKAALQRQWQEHNVRKTYQLLAVGRVEPDEAVIRLPLDRDPAHPTRRRVHANGRPAVTRYRVLAAYPGYSLIEAYPETGRTHQLRVHFAALGHPIAGDVVYGSAKRPLGLKRQFLHAARLQLTGPSGQSLDIASPLPPDLSTILTRLKGSYN